MEKVKTIPSQEGGTGEPDDVATLNLVDLDAEKRPGEEKQEEKQESKTPNINTDIEAQRQVSKALMDQVNSLPKLLQKVAKDYLLESNYPALRQLCKNNGHDYKNVMAAILREREKKDGADFMGILLEIERDMDKQRGPLVRAMLFERAIGNEEKKLPPNLSAADLFLKHMRKETKDDKRTILTPIELPDKED